MPDIYLRLMMEGSLLTKKKEDTYIKNRFDLEIERASNEYAAIFSLEESFNDPLSTPQMKRMRMIEEFKAALNFSELEKYVSEAFSIIVEEGFNYVGAKEYEVILNEFSQIESCLDEFDLKSKQTLQQVFGLQISTLERLFQIALLKFNEGAYTSSVAVFVLLTTLAPNYADYWYRLGIAAQRAEHINLALDAYMIAYELDPKMLGAWIFSAECLLSLGHIDGARSNFKKAKNLFSNEPDNDWQEMIAYMEQKII